MELRSLQPQLRKRSIQGSSMIQLDGAKGEGGGQILRSALTLALLTGQAFRLKRIRAGRSKPGLAAQHLACVRAAQKVGHATVSGAALASTELTFEPDAVKAGSYDFAIGTAGATALVVQTVALPLLLRAKEPSTVAVSGGTHAAHAPTFDYLAETWGGCLRAMGLGITLEMAKSGFYPKGGGSISAQFQPANRLRPLDLTDRSEWEVRAEVALAGLPGSIGERAVNALREQFVKADIDCLPRVVSMAGGPGVVVTVRLVGDGPVATLITSLGERGKPTEHVVAEAVAATLAFRSSGCAVDPHAADQIVLPLAFADGKSEFTVSEITQHLLTNVEVVRAFCETEFQIVGELGSPGVVRIRPSGV